MVAKCSLLRYCFLGAWAGVCWGSEGWLAAACSEKLSSSSYTCKVRRDFIQIQKKIRSIKRIRSFKNSNTETVLRRSPVWGVWRSCWTWLCGLLPSDPARCGCRGPFRSDCWQSCSGSWRWWTCSGWTDCCLHCSPFLSDLRPVQAPGERDDQMEDTHRKAC